MQFEVPSGLLQSKTFPEILKYHSFRFSRPHTFPISKWYYLRSSDSSSLPNRSLLHNVSWISEEHQVRVRRSEIHRSGLDCWTSFKQAVCCMYQLTSNWQWRLWRVSETYCLRNWQGRAGPQAGFPATVTASESARHAHWQWISSSKDQLVACWGTRWFQSIILLRFRLLDLRLLPAERQALSSMEVHRSSGLLTATTQAGSTYH